MMNRQVYGTVENLIDSMPVCSWKNFFCLHGNSDATSSFGKVYYTVTLQITPLIQRSDPRWKFLIPPSTSLLIKSSVTILCFDLCILWSLGFLKQQNRHITGKNAQSRLVPLLLPDLEISKQGGEILSTDRQIFWLQMVPPRGCAYVVMGSRQDASRGLVSLKNERINSNLVKVSAQ